jgi:hypothetical protein
MPWSGTDLTPPHILPLLDSGHVEGTLCHVMPCVEVECLRDRLPPLRP